MKKILFSLLLITYAALSFAQEGIVWKVEKWSEGVRIYYSKLEDEAVDIDTTAGFIAFNYNGIYNLSKEENGGWMASNGEESYLMKMKEDKIYFYPYEGGEEVIIFYWKSFKFKQAY